MKNASMKVRKIIGRDVPPSYPNFNGRIIIHTYASKMQLRRVINVKGPRLLNDTTTVIKLFSIVETLQDSSVTFY